MMAQWGYLGVHRFCMEIETHDSRGLILWLTCFVLSQLLNVIKWKSYFLCLCLASSVDSSVGLMGPKSWVQVPCKTSETHCLELMTQRQGFQLVPGIGTDKIWNAWFLWGQTHGGNRCCWLSSQCGAVGCSKDFVRLLFRRWAEGDWVFVTCPGLFWLLVIEPGQACLDPKAVLLTSHLRAGFLILGLSWTVNWHLGLCSPLL